MSMKRTDCLCCFIRDPNRCIKTAEWEILSSDPTQYDITHACTEHVGAMLSDSPRHSIVPLTDPPTEHAKVN